MSAPRSIRLVAVIDGIEIFEGYGADVTPLGLGRWVNGGNAIEVLHLSVKDDTKLTAETMRRVCWAFSAFV